MPSLDSTSPMITDFASLAFAMRPHERSTKRASAIVHRPSEKAMPSMCVEDVYIDFGDGDIELEGIAEFD
jgi:hypothetical protein